MADRYWVGGTANWDGTAGTKWSTTSGGAGGASVPTTADDVFFDAASGVVTCTVTATANAKSLNFTGFTGTFTGTSGINVAGSVTLVAGMTHSYTGTYTITATGTFTSGGKELRNLSITAPGGTVDLGDALLITTPGAASSLTINNGTFNTNNFSVSCSVFNSSNSNVRAINLGSSTVTFTRNDSAASWNLATTTNLTFNAGTSTIIGSASAVSHFSGGGLTYYNLTFTSAGFNEPLKIISGANTFNNLSVPATTPVLTTRVTFNANQTINGTLSTTGTAGNRRVWFFSDTYGVRRTLTVNGSTSLTDADFRDIIVNGTAAPISGTRIGNRGACSGITFSAPKTVYWNLAGTQGWFADGWASSSGGTPNTDNFPLPQDTAVFDNTGATGTVSVGTATMGFPTVDMSARTSAMTFSFSGAATCYGSWINGSGTTISGTNGLTFEGQGTKTITSAGKAFSCPITIDAYGGTVELADALDLSTNGQNLTVINGTFDTKNFSLSINRLLSNNSNVRSIKLGSSTVSLDGTTTIIDFSTSTNLTFDAGTSQINASSRNDLTINGGSGQTFYNVTFTNGSILSGGSDKTIVGSNTFNNLTFPTTSETGLIRCIISADQVVNGTLTCAGGLATRRIFLLSNTFGTTRTITANALSANDCDFRDITIAGAAAGTAPTRAGDCGGNSGITFPAPKTVYWRQAGFNGWGFDNQAYWSFTDGGSATQAAFPLAQDTATFLTYPTSSGGGASIGDPWNIGNIDMSARTSTLTYLEAASNCQMYGNFIGGSAVQTLSSTGGITFMGRGTQTITSAGTEFKFNLTVQKPSGAVQLADALTLSSIRTLTLTSGEFDAVTYNVTTGSFNSNNSNVRTLKMGSGLWTLSGTATVWLIQTITNLTFLKGTADILLSDTSTTTRTFTGGGLSYNKLTIGGTTGTSTTTIEGNNQFTELASTKTVAHTIALGTTTQTFGKWSVTGSAGNVVTLTGTGTAHVLAGSATSGIDYLAFGSIRFSATNSLAEFYAGANSTGGSNNATFLTAAPTPRTLYWVGGTGNWSDTTKWSLSSGGSGGQAIPTSLDNVIFDSASNATAYTVTIDNTTRRCNSLTISGPASGNVTLAGTQPLVCHGNVTLPATGLTRTYTGAITLSGSTTGKTFTTNIVNLSNSITVNGVGCEWTLGSDLSIGSGTFTVTNGSFNTANYTLSCSSFSSNNNNTRTISFGSSTINASTNGTAVQFGGNNLTLNAGTSDIRLNNAISTFAGGGNTFYNVTFGATVQGGSRSVTGSNTFNDLRVTPSGGTPVLTSFSITENQVINGTFGFNTSVFARFLITSSTIGVPVTLTVNTLSANDCDFRDIIITGTAAGTAPTRAGDCGGNTGITFPAPKTVYRVGTNTDWTGSSSWSLSSGGSGSNNNFPLAQDTAIINNATTGSSLTSAGYFVGSLDASTRTTAFSIAFSNAASYLGNFTLGSGITVSGTSTQTFAGRGTQTITTAGKTITFPVTIDSPGGSVTLQDAFSNPSSSPTFTLTRGTLNTNSYNVTGISFSSNNSNVRTLNMGSGGTWTLSASATRWDVATSTNFTFLGSGTVKTGGTFAGGGVAYTGLTLEIYNADLTITGNNTFANIASTAYLIIGAATLALGTTTQKVAAFSATGVPPAFRITITGNTSNLIYTGAGTITGLDYMNLQGRAYGPNGEITGIWSAGANSTNSGSLGWDFTAAPPPPPAANANFFLLFA